jgi:hypothetical protein
MKKEEILDNAKQLIAGQRAVDYGDAKDNFDRIAAGLEPDPARRSAGIAHSVAALKRTEAHGKRPQGQEHDCILREN